MHKDLRSKEKAILWSGQARAEVKLGQTLSLMMLITKHGVGSCVRYEQFAYLTSMRP